MGTLSSVTALVALSVPCFWFLRIPECFVVDLAREMKFTSTATALVNLALSLPIFRLLARLATIFPSLLVFRWCAD